MKWIGDDSGERTTDIKKFFNSIDFEYDNDFGSNEISLYLVIVGDNWWLERGEYDGAEWWEFKTIPKLFPKATIVEPKEIY